MQKKILTVIALFMFGFVLTGCMNSFDSAGYTQAMLDAMFKKDFVAYVEFTKSTEEEALQEYNNMLKSTIDTYVYELESAGLSVSEDQIAEMTQIFESLFAGVSYEVTGSTRVSRTESTVDVTVRPIMNFIVLDEAFLDFMYSIEEQWYEVMMDYFAPELESLLLSEEFLAIAETATEEELEEILMQEFMYLLANELEISDEIFEETTSALTDSFINILRESFAVLDFADDKAVTVRVLTDTENNLRYIPDEDYLSIVTSIFVRN